MKRIIVTKANDKILVILFVFLELISSIISSIVVVNFLSDILNELILYKFLNPLKLWVFFIVNVVIVLIDCVKKNILHKTKVSLIGKTENSVIQCIFNFNTWQTGYDSTKVLPVLSTDIPKAVSLLVELFSSGINLFFGLFFLSISAININYTVYLICLFVVGIIFLITYFSFPILKKYQTEIGKQFNKNYSNVSEMIENGDVTHLLNQKIIMADFNDVAKKNLSLNVKKGKVFAFVYLCKKISTVILVFVVCVSGYIVFSKTNNLQNNIPNILVLVYLVPKISNRFLAIIDWKSKHIEYCTVIKRIKKIFEHPLYSNSEKQKIDSIESIYLQNVTFSYNENPILLNATLSLKKGDFYFVKGESGCGKSTLLKILANLIPIKNGQVFVNGMDLNKIDRLNYWTKISYLSQKPSIVPDTIKNNILLDKKFDKDLFDLALKISTLDKSIENFKDGIDSIIEENHLSSGEKEKICLARALYQKKDVLLFDEAISAMDYESQINVVRHLIKYVQERNIICLFITHNNSDYILENRTLLVREGKLHVN